ncbi:MAG: hypothetical protein NTW19_12695 [Planctomycetota bacterium]|nr:hypothetical protein [Planctomycetota bacterium]
MSDSVIIAAARVVDGQGSLADVDASWDALRRRGARLVGLTIDPLEAGWDTPVEPGHFRSGCAPIEALARADALIRDGAADAVLIRGEDLLRSRYANDKAQRQRLMTIYGPDCSIPEAYTRLAHAFMRRHCIDAARFKALAAALFDNYARTAQHAGAFTPPRRESFEPATELFRLVDCANPVVDFSGAVIVAGADAASASPSAPVAIRGVGLAQSSGDGPAHLEEIARYDHLAKAWSAATAAAGIDFAREFHAGRALLEAYTCFPVVPMGFLLASGLARDFDAIEPLLAKHEITVTGGMNLARAAWNNPALNALIALCEQLQTGRATCGAVHGNGGLGYRQGVAILATGGLI